MSLFNPSLRTPVCSSCTRRILASLGPSVSTQWTQQTRHKSSKKRSVQGPDSIAVRLNRDLPGYGRKGAYVPISAGHMRNTWSRQSIASYLSQAEAKQLSARGGGGGGGAPVQRDFLFMADRLAAGRGGLSKRRQAQIDAAVRAGGTITPSSSVAEKKEEAEEAPKETAEEARRRREAEELAVPPERAVQLLEYLVPARLDFRRKVVEGGGGGADSKELFGSVSVGDVVGRVRGAMGDNDEASRVVVGEEDVRFVNLGSGGEAASVLDRVKTLGTFTVVIGVKGAEGVVTRTVRVLPAENKERGLFRQVLTD